MNLNYGQHATVNLQGLNISNGCILSIITLPQYCELYTNENKIQTTPYNILVQNNNLNLFVKPYDLSYVYQNNITNLSTTFTVQVDCPTADNIYEYSILINFKIPDIIQKIINVNYSSEFNLNSSLTELSPYKIITLPKHGKLFNSNSEINSLNTILENSSNFKYIANSCELNNTNLDEFILRYDNNSNDVKLMKFRINLSKIQDPQTTVDFDAYYEINNQIQLNENLVDKSKWTNYKISDINFNGIGKLYKANISAGNVISNLVELSNDSEITLNSFIKNTTAISTSDGQFISDNETLVFYLNNKNTVGQITNTSFKIIASNALCQQKIYTVRFNFKSSFNFTILSTNTSSGSSSSGSFRLPLISSGVYNFTVYWGDGTSELVTSLSSLHNYNYNTSQPFQIKIAGQCEGWRFGNTGDRLKILNISQWGDGFRLGNQAGYFWGCSNLNISADDALNLTGTTNLSNCFFGCSSLDSANISTWDTSKVTNMSGMFNNCSKFNQNLNNWNVGSVTDMSGMFNNCSKFNQNLNNWNVGSVTNMSSMFGNCLEFDSDISSWNTIKVTNMISMFNNCSKFNQNLNNWNVGSVTNMISMFRNCSLFDSELNNWNVSSVTDMSSMFYKASQFNKHLNNWNINTTTDVYMISMFDGAKSFNSDISSWNVSKVVNMYAMFAEASVFNSNISNWNVSSVTDMSYMFFECSKFNTDISNWNVSSVTDMTGMFYDANKFNSNISNWNVSNVSNMTGMFYLATSFKQDISNWNPISCNTFRIMFTFANMNPIINENISGQIPTQDTKNYDNLLLKWSNKLLQKGTLNTPIKFDAGYAKYSNIPSVINARNKLINEFNWQITDTGVENNLVLYSSQDQNTNTTLNSIVFVEYETTKRVFSVGLNKIIYSDDYGTTWNNSYISQNIEWQFVNYILNSSNQIVILVIGKTHTNSTVMMYSTDYGTSWTEVINSLISQIFIVSGLETVTTSMFVLLGDNKIYTSNDGLNWFINNFGINNRIESFTWLNLGNNTFRYIFTVYNVFNDIYISDDNLVSFYSPTRFAGNTNTKITKMISVPYNTGIRIFAIRDFEINYSDDNGTNWTLFNHALTNNPFSSIRYVIKDNLTRIVATIKESNSIIGIYTDDFGTTWNRCFIQYNSDIKQFNSLVCVNEPNSIYPKIIICGDNIFSS